MLYSRRRNIARDDDKMKREGQEKTIRKEGMNECALVCYFAPKTFFALALNGSIPLSCGGMSSGAGGGGASLSMTGEVTKVGKGTFFLSGFLNTGCFFASSSSIRCFWASLTASTSARLNKLLAQFSLSGFPPAPRGVPQIAVTFDIDSNGIVKVSALDQTTGKENEVKILSSGGLSKDEIDRIMKDAEEHAEEDKVRREKIELLNTAESSIDSAQKSLKEHRQFVTEEGEAKLKEAINELEELKDNEESTAEQIRTSLEKLNQAQMDAFANAYKKGEDQSGGDQTTSS